MKKHSRNCNEQEQVCELQGCVYSSLTRNNMEEHKVEAHKGLNMFACSTCDKSFSIKNRLNTHKTRVHGTLKFWCRGEDGRSGCGKSFIRKDLLNKHMKVCGDCLGNSWDQLSHNQKLKRARAELNHDN